MPLARFSPDDLLDGVFQGEPASIVVFALIVALLCLLVLHVCREALGRRVKHNKWLEIAIDFLVSLVAAMLIMGCATVAMQWLASWLMAGPPQ
jgi:steroid 5-alpha reductase family enzyme